MGNILDGKALAKEIKEQVKHDISGNNYNKPSKSVGLAVVIVGNDPASEIYVKNKKRDCEECGIYSEVYTLPFNTTTERVVELVKYLNGSKKINGIIVQLPLPSHINTTIVIDSIAVEKDVDGFTSQNVADLYSKGRAIFEPCTPAGVIKLLRHYKISMEGKNCVVLGRSNIVGLPVARLMLMENANVTVLHSHTSLAALDNYVNEADIIISAIGKPNTLLPGCVKKSAVVVDVGMNRNSSGKLVGDINPDVYNHVEWYTPVPGGVGPMTRAMLMQNTLRAYNLQVAKGIIKQ